MAANSDLILPRSFYARDTHEVAKDLLGKLLVRRWHGRELAVRINEVESYVGENDQACHAAKGKTKRTAVMFGEAGHAYVYIIYGMYHCLNIVTESAGFPAAVLIRGGAWQAPTPSSSPSRLRQGFVRQAGRGRAARQGEKTSSLNGPGKLCRALHISRAQNKKDLTKGEKLFIADDGWQVPREEIHTTPRIGVDYAGEDALLPWRYFINFSPSDEGEIKRGWN